MKKYLNLLSLALLCSAAFSAASANAAPRDPYLGASVSNGVKVFGGLQILPPLAVEVGFTDGGRYSSSNGGVKVRDLTAFVKYDLRSVHDYHYFVKGGLAYAKAENSSYKLSPALGAGIEYYVLDTQQHSATVRLELERIQSVGGLGRPVNRLGLGFSYYF